MSGTTAFYGPAYDGKHDETFSRCLERIRQGNGDTCLYLVRSDVRVRQLRDLVFKELSGCFYFPVTTFPDFIKTLYQRLPDQRRIIGKLEQKLLLEDLLREREQTSNAQFVFKHFREHPGIVLKITEFISGIRRVGFTSRTAIENTLKPVLDQWQPIHEELLTLFERYVHRLETLNAIDETGIFLDVAQRASAQQLDVRTYLKSPVLLVLEGYYELTLPEQQIFTALCAQFDHSLITLDTPLNPDHFAEDARIPKPCRIFSDLGQYLQQLDIPVHAFQSKTYHPSPQRLARQALVDTIFKINSPATPEIAHDPQILSESLSVKAYRDRPEEVTEIARAIRTLSQEGKISHLREIGVTFPVIEQYERLIREIFPRFGIPFTMFQGYSLASSPVVVTILRIMQVVFDGYSREALAQLFSSPLVQYEMPTTEKTPNEACPPGIALNADTYHDVDSFARMFGISGGREMWETKIAHYLAESEQRGARNEAQDELLPFKGRVFVEQHPLAPLKGGLSGSEVSPQRSNISALKSPLEGGRGVLSDKKITPERALSPATCYLPVVLSLLEFLARFESEELRSPDDLATLLEEGIRRLQIPQRVLQTEQRATLKYEVAALQKFLSLLETLKKELTTSVTRLRLREFFDLLRIAVQGESFYPPETLDDSVFIMGRLDTRQVQFRYLFFGGLIERDFPGKDDPNIFLSAQQAEALGLPTYKKRFQEIAHLFYLNVLNPTATLYLSYPLQEGDNDLLRSAYVESLVKALAPTEAKIIVEGAQQVQKLEQVFTYSELYHWLGKQLTQTVPSAHSVQDVIGFIEHERGAEALRYFRTGVSAQKLRIAQELSPFDGILRFDWSKALLHSRYAKHVYFVSEFDQYSQCPMKFFFQRILSLQPLQDLTFAIPALAISALLHRILYRFYTGALADIQPSSLPGEVDKAFLQGKTNPEQWVLEARSRMAIIVQEEFAHCDFSGVFWERLVDSLCSGLRQDSGQKVAPTARQHQGLLATFIDLEAYDRDHVLPSYLNAHFGMSDVPAANQNWSDFSELPGYVLSAAPYQLRAKDADGNPMSVNIRGTIDRIDLEFLPEQEKQCVVVYDYKTGSIPAVQKIKAGLLFSLPLHLLAVQAILGDAYQVVAGGYYQVKSPKDIGKKGFLGSKEYADQQYFAGSRSLLETHAELVALLEAYKARTIHLVQGIRAGRFHPTLLGPQDAGCHYCEYQQICRVDHQRLNSVHP